MTLRSSCTAGNWLGQLPGGRGRRRAAAAAPYLWMPSQVLSEELQTHVEQGPGVGGREHVGAVQVQEDLPNEQHLAAVAFPRAREVLKKCDSAEAAASSEGAQLRSCMAVALLLQLGVQLGGQLVQAQVLNGSVQSLQTARHRRCTLHRSNRLAKAIPVGCFKISGKPGLQPQRFDH